MTSPESIFKPSFGFSAMMFGDALDHPPAVHRFDYRDSVFSKYDTGPAPISMQPLTIYPHTNWRGDYQIGTFSTGETQRCVQVPSQPGDHETVDGYVPGGPGTINPTLPYCLAAVRWAGNYVWLDHSVRKAPPGTDGFWVGSLVHNKRDLTGNLYMRNRYYDATAGRFKQEDPIGLAGGLNAYGFANGDPVTYSDPYGLCPVCVGAAVALLSVPNGRTGDAVLDDPAKRRPMEAAFNNAPHDEGGYALEQGASCSVAGGCLPGQNATREDIRIPVNRNTTYDYHTHGNVGLDRESGIPGDKYTRGPSDTDVSGSGAYVGLGIMPTTYIIDDKYIYRLTPSRDGSVTMTTYHRFVIPRGPDNPNPQDY
ncbi:RHS repeat-associated core domain-containing protein [Longimicrobium terrae]|uniref:RHS repeat-associated protein n=1 Tax=Longimicrobium terrae TaxID=1639882 RepID=A0A841H256_9BACT|nr:RHS repeat-associated core domain-containing protein [Longimicrobium terrae]MBB4637978.1 RHS repeat-associated protein [Longimicrobium terrae]MBB6072225.1 RHS repeat-associated protein [Longimicrobium terrae]NNC28351.1 RHS repeat-associated core domain-containing protein [Longimicrobium terrae]